ncbi:putative regulatory protein, TetR family [Cupriavidus necator]|uniref:Putative regulatory protein, TetR family n=2 Tax=Cupriavidus necator TaxID=106590 RepID=A0A1K0JKY2_CUPNE|nr:putative regulatory protein, TetR family [Cupriavidus necator]
MTKNVPATPPLREARASIRPARQARSEQSLQKMLAAGRALIEEKGNLDGLSITELTVQAGTSVGAFYRRFENKEAFFAVVQEAVLEEMRETMQHIVATEAVWHDGPATAIADRMMELYVRNFRENRGLFHASLLHFPAREATWSPVRESNVRAMELMLPLLIAHLPAAKGVDWDFEARVAMQAIVGMLVNIILNDPGPLHLHDKHFAAQVKRQFRRALGLPAH